jgi:hypothetical protein
MDRFIARMSNPSVLVVRSCGRVKKHSPKTQSLFQLETIPKQSAHPVPLHESCPSIYYIRKSNLNSKFQPYLDTGTATFEGYIPPSNGEPYIQCYNVTSISLPPPPISLITIITKHTDTPPLHITSQSTQNGRQISDKIQITRKVSRKPLQRSLLLCTVYYPIWQRGTKWGS